MSNFNNIQEKLQEFVQKYYINELIKGLILFFSFGLLYFIFTLFVESILWLKPTARTILFWVFIIGEATLLFRYILRPILKFIGIQKGISIEEASIIIGKHFKEIDDKLLNIIQLNNSKEDSELLLASIDQKSDELQPIVFKKAISFGTNKKYLKYLVIPMLIWAVTYASGNVSLFSQSYERVLNHDVVYLPPAPFAFTVLNSSLDVIEGDPIRIKVETIGTVIPEDVKIIFNNQSNFIQNTGIGKFEYTFSSVEEPITFFIEANGVESREYNINIIRTPKILGFELYLKYPSYTGKKAELIKNTGNITVPNGTTVSWKLQCKNTTSVSFIGEKKEQFDAKGVNKFEFKKRLFKNTSYKIATNNEQLQEFEQLNFSATVIKDVFPKIEVRSDIDSIEKGPAQFIGQLSDDYAIKKLELVYYDLNNSKEKLRFDIPVNKSSFEEFYYVFPEGLQLIEGVGYELYFEVFDNDAVYGSKSSKSRKFSYYNQTADELQNQLLEDQNKTIKDLEKSIEKNKKVKEDFKDLQESLQNKSEMNWNDQKKLESFIKRQNQYQEMMQKQTEDIQKNLEDQPKSSDKNIEEKRADLEKRLEEAKQMNRQEELLKELEKLAEKLDKEKLTEKLKQLTQKNRQNERNLERILELTKRFYVEQKANQIKEKIEELAKDQEELSDDEKNTSEKQEELNSEFDDIKKELNDLEKENQKLHEPMSFPKTEKEEKSIKEDMKEASDELKNSEEKEESEDSESKEKSKESKNKASKKQKSAAQKMKKMSSEMQGAMESMQGESMDEDIEMLRAILENLVEFSFQQEDLMDGFSGSNTAHPEFANRLKKQNTLKEYFEHIDDSLYTLSMRQPKIGSQIFKDLADVHYYLDESLIHFTEDQYNVGVADQQFVMTSTNNIAVLLSNILNSMQNANPSMGKGDGNSFSLPDIIKKQGEAIDKMEEGMKKKGKGKKEGDGEGEKGERGEKEGQGEGEQMNGELYEIYKEQQMLRLMLEESLKDKNTGNNGVGENALKQMEQLEKDLLEKGFSNEVLSQMMQLKYELLKLEEATYKQGQDSKRESKVGERTNEIRNIKEIDKSKLWFNEKEVLIRQSLPLRARYKIKVQNYFSIHDSIQ